ncbi:Uncharacterised protein [Serratia marcescens]|uniref:hypothetical protein n=1 Tax=Serratia TaxID=613 RepID=UPI000744E7BF|nr:MULTISPECIES: hypothetical protein [Serratia]CUZ29776.1 Uncharacterised protein [Serratia marcescens]CUZ88339.1 Uncharacterised protein [Serratia marcescens]CVA02235.1 Uncharacterised protein [Serratia marcescens]CVA11974.1 Uncharacterised protein [Serratia marcescens]CVA33625.1 Uncharacterised protein [Serratia marcescens]
MTNTVLFLDDASKFIGDLDKVEAEKLALSMINSLRKIKKANNRVSVNLNVPIGQYPVSDNWVLQNILVGNGYREEWEFIRLLNSRSPLSSEIEDLIVQQLNDKEFRTANGNKKSIALAYASLLDSATVSYDIIPDWSTPIVEVVCDTLEDDGNISSLNYNVKNVSSPNHVTIHEEWLRSLGLVESPTVDDFWNERNERFPMLRFLKRTKKDLFDLYGASMPYNQAINAIISLSQDAENWEHDEAWPNFSRYATDESETRRKLCWLDDEDDGESKCFGWHVRFTGSFAGRIHFFVDSKNRKIIIGYIGMKLSKPI